MHPQGSFDRPGWLRIESYCLGMITGWGIHGYALAVEHIGRLSRSRAEHT